MKIRFPLLVCLGGCLLYGTVFSQEAWTLTYTSESYVDRTRMRQGSVSNGTPTIFITDVQSQSQGEDEHSPRSRVEFVENERSLGAIGSGEYIFRAGLDPETKLKLAAAMQAVGS